MRRRRGQSAAKSSSSLLMILVIAAAVLAFVPLRATLATGSSFFVIAPPDALLQLVGTHVSIDSLGIFMNTSLLRSIFFPPNGAIPVFAAPPGTLGLNFNDLTYVAVKAQKITVDISYANGSIGGLLQPFGTGPASVSSLGRQVIQIRIILLSTTFAGYKHVSGTTNKYGEVSLAGLDPVLSVTFDRVFLDLFEDPVVKTTTYVVSADLTVYQAIALVAEGASL